MQVVAMICAVLSTSFVFGCALPPVLPTSVRIASDTWTIRVRAGFGEPIDSGLPKYAKVADVRVSANNDDEIGIVWTRAVDSDKLSWDESAEVWRIAGSNRVLDAGQRIIASLPPPPRVSDLLKPGEYLGMAVIETTKVSATAFHRDFGAGSGFSDRLLGSVVFARGRWFGAFALAPTDSRMSGGFEGIAIVPFDAPGLGSADIVIPQAFTSSPVQYFELDQVRDVFWLRNYSLSSDPPEFMGGVKRQKLEHTRIEGATVAPPKPVYHRPSRPRWIHEHEHRVL